MSVNITLGNGGLNGTVQTNDGIMGLVTTGYDEGDYVVGDTLLLTGMTSLATAGITTSSNAWAYKQVKEFYDQAKDGAQLYLMLVPPTVSVSEMANPGNPSGARKLLDYAAGAIKIIGVLSNDWDVDDAIGVTVSAGLNGDCYTAAAYLHTLCEEYATAEMPLRGIVGGTSYTGVAGDLIDGTTLGCNRVAMVIGNTEIGHPSLGGAAVGLCLGTLAAIPVQQKISRVRSGKLTPLAVYLQETRLVSTNGDVGVIAGKGYITFTMYSRRAGIYWKSDPTLTVTTDDYCMLVRGRVIDKAHAIAYQVYLNEVDDTIPVRDDGSGRMDPNFGAFLQHEIIGALEVAMKGPKEISGVACFVDPEQNVVSTSHVNIVLTVTPDAYATDINILLGFGV